MRIHAEILSEVVITAGTLRVMASLRAHHAEITLRQFFEAWVAVALAVTLFCCALAIETGDLTRETEFDGGANIGVEMDLFLVQA